MATFTLHLPRDARPGDPEALERSEIVKDAFSWGAFFFTFLWFVFHRLWLAGLLVFIAIAALNLAASLLHLHPAAVFLAQGLLVWLIGLEANSLRRWTLARNGMPVADVVNAPDRDDAEARFFARYLARPAAPQRPAAAGPIRSRSSALNEPVLGLFPDMERGR